MDDDISEGMMRVTGFFFAGLASILLLVGVTPRAGAQQGPQKRTGQTYKGWPVIPYPAGISARIFKGPALKIYRVVRVPKGSDKGLTDPRYLPQQLPDKLGRLGRIKKHLPPKQGQIGRIKQRLPHGLGDVGNIKQRLPHGLGDVGKIKQRLPHGQGHVGGFPAQL